MISIPKVVSFLSCGLLLCLGVSHSAYAANQEGASRLEQATVIKGVLVNIDYGDYVVKQKDGQEVRVHVDSKTLTMGQLKKGDRVEAKVDAENHALSIRSLP